MNAMIAAIKKRKSGGEEKMGDHQDMAHPGQHAEDATNDMHALAANLNDHQKTQLKSILSTHQADNSEAIAKGGASTEEQGKIEGSIKEENSENALEEKQEQDHDGGPGNAVDSDAIGKSLLDRKHLSGAPQGKPRNLGERMKQEVASKLKAKGKL